MSARRDTRRVVEVVDFDSQWHLDRRVPIALIVTFLLQGATLLAWGNGLTADVATMKQDIVELKSANSASSGKLDQLIRVETRLQYMAESLQRVERTIERIITDARPQEVTKRAR